MPGIKDRLEELRAKHPFLDHLLRTVEHYSHVNGSNLAGAVTFFGFLSFFPILALAFAVVGFVGKAYPGAQQDLIDALNSVFPGMIGNGDGQIPLDDIQKAAPSIFSVGLLVVLYSGLSWVSAMRSALLAVFELSSYEQPNFATGKLRDLATLVAIGVTLILSVSISGIATSASEWILDLVGLDSALKPLLIALGVVVGLVANMVLFFALFRLLAQPDTPNQALWQGALLGAIGFEVLKQASALLLRSTQQQPAFQAFGIALILLIWINYFSRVVMYAAAWAHTSAPARAAHLERIGAHAAREASTADATAAARGVPPGYEAAANRDAAAIVGEQPRKQRTAFAAGGAAMLALVAVVRRIVNRD